MAHEKVIIMEYWQLLLALVGFVIWLIRLESKVITHGKDIDRNNKLAWKKIDCLDIESKDCGKSIAEIKGMLSNKD